MSKLDQVERLLLPFIESSSRLEGGAKVLERTARLMGLFSNPQNDLKVIHIAGTSGKTSTAYYISVLLSSAGKKVGLTVSPHVYSITERVQINNQLLDSNLFADLLTEFIKRVSLAKLQCTYFELIYSFSFWVFERQKVDYAVVETGMGGLLDATNIAKREDKICVITDIGFDHMAVLGDSLSAIARQKAGIIHYHNPVITYAKPKDIFRPIQDQVTKYQSQLVVIDDPKDQAMFNSDLADYQKRNWWLAKQTFDYVAKRDKLTEPSTAKLKQTQTTYIPGRLEQIKLRNKTIILDGAHNSQKLTALVSSLKKLYPKQKAIVILAMKEDKDASDIAKILKPIAETTIVTKFLSSAELPVKAVEPIKLKTILEQSGLTRVEAEADQDKALKLAIDSDSALIIITGSFYLLGQIRSKLIK